MKEEKLFFEMPTLSLRITKATNGFINNTIELQATGNTIQETRKQFDLLIKNAKEIQKTIT